MQEIRKRLVVAGGGPAGICAALAAARLGIDTVLVGNRPVLGGNSSSEIRVWTRGATGAGNLFAEEMGIWGGLKLRNFYRNPDGNPIFWSETLLDAVIGQQNLEFFLNTELFDLRMEGNRIVWVEGVQQGTERRLRFLADCFIDATGDGTLAARAGLPYYIGDHLVEPGQGPQRPGAQIQGSSILYYTRREDHPVTFIPPDYAYGMEKIEELLGRGGRVITEQSSGSDCWWFEYGGIRDTIGDAQDMCSAMNRPVLNEGDQPQSTMWGHMLVVFKDSEYKEQAAELAKTLVSDEVAMDYFTNNGMPPVTKSAASLDEVKNDAYLNGFLESTSTARLEETARMANANEVKTIITEELQYALLGQKSAEQAVSDMAARLEAL